jgi:hypothetical protein
MGGWSGGVYTRFRNWVTDKANSINPQAALFDQEDDGFAAGLNNCITKDGLNKPSAAMDWNGQNLTGVLNLANTGTISFNGGKVTGNAAGNWGMGPPTSGIDLTVNGISGINIALFVSGTAGNTSAPDVGIGRAGSTVNTIQQGPNLTISDTSAVTASAFQHSGGQTELWQFNGSWVQRWRVTTGGILQSTDAGGTMQDVGWKNLPGNVQNTNYTCVLADSGKIMITNSGGPFTHTIPSNASVAYPVGTVLTFMSVSGNSLSIAINTDSMVLAGSGGTTGTRTLVNSGVATAIKSAATQWIISGTGLS